MITVSFEDQNLHDVCVELERAEQLLGSIHAAALVTLISDIMALDHAEQLMDFLGDDVEVSVDDSLIVSIGTEYRVTMVVAGQRHRRDEARRIVWATVTRLKLTQISRWP